MSEKNLYYSLWRNHLNDIESKMSIATMAGQSLLLKRQEFETYGNRKASGYTFMLKIIHGRVVNNVKGSAVARDLYGILNESEKVKSMFKEKNFRITLGKDYILKIRTL